MSFRRETIGKPLPTKEARTAAMVGIGMAFAAPPAHNADIEGTLVAASEDGMLHDDLRTLAVLVTWLGVHARMINADKLVRLVARHDSARVRAFWSSCARWQHKDRRFARLAKCYRGPRVDLLAVGTEFQVKRHGEDPRFDGTPLRVAANTLRDRPADVLTVKELAARHRGYRTRLMMGPSYRADMWAALEGNSALTATELAHETLGSFASAWQVKRDWDVVRSSPATADAR